MSPNARTRMRVPGRGRFHRSSDGSGPPLILESSAPATVHGRDRLFRRVLVLADVLAGLIVAGLTALAFGHDGPGSSALLLPALFPFVNTGMSLYRRDELLISKSTLDEAPAIFQAATLTTVLAYLVESALLPTPFGAQVMAFTLLNLTALTMLLRRGGRALARRLTPPERCLLVGAVDMAERFASKLRMGSSIKAELVGRLVFAPPEDSGKEPRLTSPTDLHVAVRELAVDRVVIAGDGAPLESVHEAIRSTKALGVKVSLLPRTFEVVGSSVAFDYIGGLTVLGLRYFGLSRRDRLVKRTFDVVGSGVLLTALLPLLALIAVAIRLQSRGPVLFRQTRVGRDGRHFQMLKFRSMVADAEARKQDLWDLNEAEGLFKIDKDPRITPVGRVMRRCAFDELPQLINVLRREMSIVGPRPLVVDEDELVRGWHRRRLDLTPGMTGPWQVLGAARVPLHEMVAIDYLYVANWSLWGDTKLLLRTVAYVLARRGQ